MGTGICFVRVNDFMMAGPDMTEIFPLVDEEGVVIGKATREECHNGNFWLHPVVHLHVFNSNFQVYLQKRALNKDIQPGKWDTSVGGHVGCDETVEEALRREAFEELGIQDFKTLYFGKYTYLSEREFELVNSFYTFFDGDILPDPGEISEGRFWDASEIRHNLGINVFTPNFEHEANIFLKKIMVQIKRV